MNESEYQEKIKEKYSHDNLFKDKKIVQRETVKQDIVIVKYKESVITKLFNKIKKFLK